MNIFEALRESHENQRNLSEQLIQTHGLTEERKELFDALKNELYAHSVAEDRYLANSNMRCDSFKSHMIINKLSKFL